MKTPRLPDVFRYTDYRAFLKDCFEFKKGQNSRYSYRMFSMAAGLSSPSALKEVIDGKKGLTLASIPKFAAPFKLNKTQTKFFENLVMFNQAKDEDRKSRHFREMIRLQRLPRTRKISTQEFTFYGDWYNAAIREIINLPGFVNEPRWIAKKLQPPVTPGQAQDAVNLLKELGFVKTRKGKLVQDVPKLDIDPDISKQTIRHFNRSMIELGWEAIERFHPSRREVSGVTCSMSRECFEDVREMIRKFKDQVLNYICQHPGEVDSVYQLNFQLFPLINDEDPDKEKGNRRK